MKVIETKDLEDIKKVLCHPEIYRCISDDYCPESSEFEPPLSARYIAGYVDGDIIGLMIYHNMKEGLKCHIQVLPEYRKEYAREFAEMVLVKDVDVYSEIPACYPNVIRFAKSFGFKEIGTIKDSHLKNGVNYDVIKFRKLTWAL